MYKNYFLTLIFFSSALFCFFIDNASLAAPHPAQAQQFVLIKAFKQVQLFFSKSPAVFGQKINLEKLDPEKRSVMASMICEAKEKTLLELEPFSKNPSDLELLNPQQSQATLAAIKTLQELDCTNTESLKQDVSKLKDATSTMLKAHSHLLLASQRQNLILKK